jgi:uncharacterized protein (DUF2249 family)
MIIEHYHNKLRYTLSNDNLEVGDEVYPIANGRCLDDDGWILHNFDFRDFMCGFPDEPHIIKDLNYDNGRQGKPYQVRTDHGHSPIECYYKIIKIEERIVEYHDFGPNGLKLTKRDEWVEIK